MTGERRDVAVLGAGLAGLAAAGALVAGGHRVVVVDKGRSVGGRLATRRIDGARLDHGAQFFTVRGDELRALVERLSGESVVYEWCRGFGPEPDGHPRYATAGGMNNLAKQLATGLDVRVETQVGAIEAVDGRWRLTFDGGAIEADAVIATPPVPQTLALLDAGGVTLRSDLAGLRDVRYFSTLAVLATLDGAPAVPGPGGVQLDDGPFTFVADNRRKGISDEDAITFHAAHDLSAARYEEDESTVLADLVAEARPWLGDASIRTAQLKRWRYAGPVEPWPEAATVAVDGPAPLVLAGDAFNGPKVEGAYRSGLAAARTVAERLDTA
ncbi:MAG: FAD-dependent oxidoreductase [Actinomycetota bacterium]|nr:FAD-dependent oxidoreductase [Actinomycetota bacterium]